MEKPATLCGAVADSFEKGMDLRHQTPGRRLSESTVQPTTAVVVQRIADHLAGGTKLFGRKQPRDWFRDGTGRTVRYIGIGATGAAAGEGGGPADGRMAYVSMIFNPLPDAERGSPSVAKPDESMRAGYVSGRCPLAEMGPLVRTQGAQVGLDDAEVWVAI